MPGNMEAGKKAWKCRLKIQKLQGVSGQIN